MNNTPGKPKIIVETGPATSGSLIIGENSSLARQLREILKAKGIKINDSPDFDYVFQLANLKETGSILEKAKIAGAKFFLIIDEQETRLSQEAESQTKTYIQTHRLNARIIKLSGFAGQEIEAVKRILKIAFSQTKETVINLTGPGVFLTESQELKKIPVKKGLIFWTGLIISFILLLGSPLLFILTNVFLGTWALKNLQQAVLTSDFQKGKNLASFTEKRFTSAQNGFITIEPLFRFLGKGKEAKEIREWLDIGQNLGQISGDLIEVGQEGQRLVLSVLGQKQIELGEALPQIAADASLVQRELALIEARVPPGPLFLTKNLEQIKTLRKGLASLESLLPVAPWILGLDQKRTYLLLLQNNFELRPGGGFIGTIGLLTFTDGRLDLKIEDVYTADGQLKGHIEPPKPIRDFLSQIHWYLRDSNWSPDFPTNAQRAAWFLEKELGIKPDGVIAFDLSLAQKILKLTGPIELGDFQEKITADNLFLKAEIYSQENFFPGSTQKKDFLGALANKLFLKLTSENRQSAASWLGLAKIATEAVEEKHLFAYFTNELAQGLISKQGWGGEVKQVTCNMEHVTCVEDYLMIVEANLGVNKVNYFIKRQISQEVNLTQENLVSKVVITYENTSPVNVSFGGSYKNYLRILTGNNILFESISLDGQPLGRDKIDSEQLADKTSTGFLVEVAPLTKKTVEFNYKIPYNFSENEFIYQLLVQKQPGTDKDAISLVINSPWQILETNFPSLVRVGNLSYNGDLSVDRIFSIKLRK